MDPRTAGSAATLTRRDATPVAAVVAETPVPVVSTAVVVAQVEALREMVGARCPVVSENEAIDALGALERLKNALAGVQAAVTVEFDQMRRAGERSRGVPAASRGRGVAGEVALARRESPARGARLVGLATALTDMPHTRAALERGEISEWRATIMCQETGWLSVADRVRVDAVMAGHLAVLGEKKLRAEARRVAQSLDLHGAVNHLEHAVNERRVTVRPATGGMAYLTGFVPLTQAVAAYATLVRDADSARSTGETGGRGKGQYMADRLVELVTGHETATGTPVEIELVMSDQYLFGASDSPGWLPGHGPLPAALARKIASNPDTMVWVRRLFTAPETGQLVGMDSRRRVFSGELRKMIRLRDDLCRTPWCGAPIRHADHALPHADGGDTSLANGSGLCERCNYVKQQAGWRHHTTDAGLTVTTPTGHRYTATDMPLTRHHDHATERLTRGPLPERAGKKTVRPARG